MLDGFLKNLIIDSVFRKIMSQDLIDGQHRNPTNNPFYFTTTYLHHPNELKLEIVEAGLRHRNTIAIEGMGWLLSNIKDLLDREETRELLLNTIGKTETEESLMGMSAHIMGIAQK